jgi:hypothetical protein
LTKSEDVWEDKMVYGFLVNRRLMLEIAKVKEGYAHGEMGIFLLIAVIMCTVQ